MHILNSPPPLLLSPCTNAAAVLFTAATKKRELSRKFLIRGQQLKKDKINSYALDADGYERL